jgi:hypothetical protein
MHRRPNANEFLGRDTSPMTITAVEHPPSLDTGPGTAAGSTRADRLLAFAAGGSVMALYVATMPRDVVLGTGFDTAKFAYMPRVLGVPHAPGYPLYLMLGWAFSWLPFGTLAFRMNVLSACFAAIAVALVARILRELRCSRSVSYAVAVLTGTGRLFWSQSIVAEVYTLHVALIAGVLLALLVWRRTRRDRPLYVAVLCFALGLAHHTDIALIAPAMLLFVAMTDARTLRDPTIVGRSIGIVAAGLSLYAYTIVRTRQGAPFVEAGATGVAAVWHLLRGEQFQHLLRVPTPLELWNRLSVLTAVFVVELKRGGILLTALGLAALGRRHRPALAFIGVSAAAMMAFIAGYHAFDVQVFLLPVIVLCWICVGAGAGAIHRHLTLPRGMRRAAPLVVPVVMLGWAAWYPFKNFAANNLSARTSDGRFLTRLFAELPPGAALVDSEIVFTHLLLYKLLGEGVAGKPLALVAPPLSAKETVQFAFVRDTPEHRIVRGGFDAIDGLRRSGREVFAFRSTIPWLRAAGFALEPVRWPDLPLPEYLSQLEPDLIVAAAVPASAAAGLAGWQEPFAALGSTTSVRGDRCVAIIGVTGSRRGAATPPHVTQERVRAPRDVAIPTSRVTPLVDIEARCDRETAAIAVNGADVAWGDSSVSVVVMNRYGAVQTITSATPASGYRVPFDWPRLAVARVAAPRSCVALESAWIDISHLAGAAVALRPEPSAVVHLYLASDQPLRPAPLPTRGPIVTREWTVDTSDARDSVVLDGLLAADRLDRARLHGRRYVERLEIEADAEPSAATTVLNLRAGVAHPIAVARAIESSGSEACAGTLGTYDLFAGCLDCIEGLSVNATRDDLFGSGWHTFEPDKHGGVRWTTDADAHLLLPLAKVGTIDVDLRAQSADDRTASAIGLIVNGRELPSAPLAPDPRTHRWSVPAEAWRKGINDVIVRAYGSSMGTSSHRPFIGVRHVVLTLRDKTAWSASQ